MVKKSDYAVANQLPIVLICNDLLHILGKASSRLNVAPIIKPTALYHLDLNVTALYHLFGSSTKEMYFLNENVQKASNMEQEPCCWFYFQSWTYQGNLFDLWS